jgi:hypothetical protein
VQRTHYDWMAKCAGTVDGPQLTATDVLLNPFPMVNMAGLSGMFLPWLKVGGLLVQHHPFDLPVFLRQIERLAGQVRPRDPQLLRLERGHRHAAGHSRSGGARAVLPALRRGRPDLVGVGGQQHQGKDRRSRHRSSPRGWTRRLYRGKITPQGSRREPGGNACQT